MPHRDEEIALLRQEIEVLIGERQALLQVAGGAAALIASLDSDELPDHAIHAADILATAVNQLTEDTLNDALQAVHVHIEHASNPENQAAWCTVIQKTRPLPSSSMNTLHCGRFRLPLDRPLIMGIVNLTPDSLSGDGHIGQADCTIRAVAHARRLIAEGADLLDLGAESSRPGAQPTPLAEELARLLPVLEALHDSPVPVSVDTYKPAVMRAALAAGASLINDINGLRDPAALAAVADSEAGVCVMHMQGQPLTMQQAPAYGEVVSEVHAFLMQQLAMCEQAGIARARIVLDPGFGFGKTLAHNLALFRALPQWQATWQEENGGCPLLVGVSRKSMLGQITGQPVEGRLPASLAAAVMAAECGARIIRVHDVAATRDALSVWAAIRGHSGQSGGQQNKP